MAGVPKKEAMETLSRVRIIVRPVRGEDITEVEDPIVVEEAYMVTIEDPILAI